MFPWPFFMRRAPNVHHAFFLCNNLSLESQRYIQNPEQSKLYFCLCRFVYLLLYYVDPSTSDFARAGLNYTTDGETNLIGFHTEGNYHTAVSESFAIMGLTLFAEYIDAIAVISFTGPDVTPPTASEPEVQMDNAPTRSRSKVSV